MLAWIDLEMPGLDPARHTIVEIATLITDDDLTIIEEGPDLVVHATPEQLAEMDEFVLNMHTRSGLLPEIEDYLHYRSVDVSTIKELCRRWRPEVYKAAPSKKGGHRALQDIRESVEELAYSRAAFFTNGATPPPPPPAPAPAGAAAAATPQKESS